MLDPKRSDHLEQAAGAAVGLSSRVPETAFTAGILGSERTGHGVLGSGDGVVLAGGCGLALHGPVAPGARILAAYEALPLRLHLGTGLGTRAA